MVTWWQQTLRGWSKRSLGIDKTIVRLRRVWHKTRRGSFSLRHALRWYSHFLQCGQIVEGVGPCKQKGNPFDQIWWWPQSHLVLQAKWNDLLHWLWKQYWCASPCLSWPWWNRYGWSWRLNSRRHWDENFRTGRALSKVIGCSSWS